MLLLTRLTSNRLGLWLFINLALVQTPLLMLVTANMPRVAIWALGNVALRLAAASAGVKSGEGITPPP
eukprot:1199098-Prorocentrum_lima.AAC.1